MGDEVFSRMIKIASLKEYQKCFQKDLGELIQLYLMDGKRKITALKKAFEEKHWENFIGALQELRYRSMDMGAHQFSFYCLTVEIAALERQQHRIPYLIIWLESAYIEVQKELERLQTTSLCKKPVPV